MIGAALPYLRAPNHIAGISTYGALVLLACLIGCVAATLDARRRGLPAGVVAGLTPILVIGAMIGAHLFDVAFVQSERSPGLWWRMYDGISLFGAFPVVALLTWAWARGFRLELGKLADSVALGFLVALVIGRLACALVHDHLGVATSLPIGIDVPAEQARWFGLDPSGATMRVHDLGFEELVLAVPLCIAIWLAAMRVRRPGLICAITAIAYASIRFPLDFLRVTDERHVGLTAAQYGCIVLAFAGVMAAVALSRRSPAASA